MAKGSNETVLQPEANIGTLGHVDNGKSTLVQALTGIWTAKHSEELRRGITIRIGYADAAFYKCPNHEEFLGYTSQPQCNICKDEAEFLRMVSFVDCPGHHSLMVTMLSGATLMDGALFVVAADLKSPQAQDREHMIAAKIAGIKNLVVVQNKIDIINKKRAIENYKEIEEFIQETYGSSLPIIPVSAQHALNMDVLIEAIEKHIPTPKRDPNAASRMYILRSFDINKPGTDIRDLKGGVLGGSIVQGVFEVGDDIEIKPGIRTVSGGKTKYEPLHTEIRSLQVSLGPVKEAKPGGLVGVGTALDPSLTKSDGLVGNVIGKIGALPSILDNLTLDVKLFERAVGTEDMVQVEKVKTNEALVLNIATTVTSGIVTSSREDIIDINLKKPVCIEPSSQVALSRRIGEGWRLIGYGTIK